MGSPLTIDACKLLLPFDVGEAFADEIRVAHLTGPS